MLALNAVTPARILNFARFKPWYRRANKKALLAYLVDPVINELSDIPTNRFSNHGLAINWVKVLNELGYSVDLIDWQDDKFKLKQHYDLVVLHGGKTFKNIKHSGKYSKLIYFSTGSYWKFNNAAEDERLKNFVERYGIKVKRDRYIYDSEEEVNRAANGIVVLGNHAVRETYPPDLNVICINSANYPDDHFDNHPKNYRDTKNNYVFFAGAGNIHKGLDLVVEAFSKLKDNLYIVTVLDKDVIAALKQPLKRKNIHLLGELNMRTPEFYKVMDLCSFVIMPSCAEGQPGSVLEAMNLGLIPIVSRESGLDAQDYGVVLPGNTVQDIIDTVISFQKFSAADIEKMSIKVRQVALSDHNPAEFKKNLKSAILKIVKP